MKFDDIQKLLLETHADSTELIIGLRNQVVISKHLGETAPADAPSPTAASAKGKPSGVCMSEVSKAI